MWTQYLAVDPVFSRGPVDWRGPRIQVRTPYLTVFSCGRGLSQYLEYSGWLAGWPVTRLCYFILVGDSAGWLAGGGCGPGSSHEPRMLPWIGVSVFTMGLVFRVFRLAGGWLAGWLPGCVILYWLGIGYRILMSIFYVNLDIGYRI